MITRHHSRSGKLDKPESCHDQGRASFLNLLQAPGKATVGLVINSGSLLALMRLATARGEWTAAETSTAKAGLLNAATSRADVLALIERGYVEEAARGFRITDAGNELVRALLVFVRGFQPEGARS